MIENLSAEQVRQIFALLSSWSSMIEDQDLTEIKQIY